MTWQLIHGDARHVSHHLEPSSVDAIITSPPYFGLRSYRDGGEHYDGQIGSEPSPCEFVDALIECTRDWLTVLKPGGSIFVNLGDKRAGSGGHNNAGVSSKSTLQGNGHIGGGPKMKATRRNAPDRYNQNSDGIRPKSLMGLPWRYANRCVDELGLILRADIVWDKPNGLPESVTDRVRQSHEYWFHFTREPRYFAAVDEIREPHTSDLRAAPGQWSPGRAPDGDSLTASATAKRGGWDDYVALNGRANNPLGKLPGSVWRIPSEPLQVPDHLDVDHFAAFPSEWPRRLILGWTPSGWCQGCGEARRPVVEKMTPDLHEWAQEQARHRDTPINGGVGRVTLGIPAEDRERTILGYVCACPNTDAPTTPAQVLDPFCGTGTTPAVAHLLGRHGIGIDLSRDYLRLAEWRCTSDERLRAKVLDRTGIPRPQPPKIDGQLDMFGEAM